MGKEILQVNPRVYSGYSGCPPIRQFELIRGKQVFGYVTQFAEWTRMRWDGKINPHLFPQLAITELSELISPHYQALTPWDYNSRRTTTVDINNQKFILSKENEFKRYKELERCPISWQLVRFEVFSEIPSFQYAFTASRLKNNWALSLDVPTIQQISPELLTWVAQTKPDFKNQVINFEQIIPQLL